MAIRSPSRRSDVTDAAAANAAVQFAVDTFGRLDVLVNNAGYGNVAPFEQTTPEAFKAQIDTNFYGVVNLARAALPVMPAASAPAISSTFPRSAAA